MPLALPVLSWNTEIRDSNSPLNEAVDEAGMVNPKNTGRASATLNAIYKLALPWLGG